MNDGKIEKEELIKKLKAIFKDKKTEIIIGDDIFLLQQDLITLSLPLEKIKNLDNFEASRTQITEIFNTLFLDMEDYYNEKIRVDAIYKSLCGDVFKNSLKDDC
jgi:hypothetical protein